jgi:molecular chaperone GrpE (heat shock protein)
MNPKFLWMRDASPSGRNFKNSQHPFWRTNGKCKNKLEESVRTLEKGQDLVLCFITSKVNKGTPGMIIGFALYDGHHDMTSEPTKPSHLITNKEQGWEYESNSGLHIDYKNRVLCNTEKKQFHVCIQNMNSLFHYEPKHNIRIEDLQEYYQSFYKVSEQEPSAIFPILPLEPAENDDLEECQKRLEEKEAELQREKEDLEKRKREKAFKQWIQSEDAFQYYLKAYSEQSIQIQKIETLCLVTAPTKGTWCNLSEDKKRNLYLHYLFTKESQ